MKRPIDVAAARKRRLARMQAIQRLKEKYGIRDEDINKPGFYSFDRITGRPILPEKPTRRK